MMKKLCMIGLAAMLATPAAFAGQMPAGQVAGYLTMTDAEFDDGTGLGIRGWASVSGPWFVHGEYQTVGLETPGPAGIDVDLNELRVGGGLVGEMQKGIMWIAKAELVDFGGDFDEGGFGVHGGLMFEPAPALGLFATLGFLTTDNTDGLELNFGGEYSFTKAVSGILDYRTYMGEADGGGDFEITDIRFAVAYNFY